MTAKPKPKKKKVGRKALINWNRDRQRSLGHRSIAAERDDESHFVDAVGRPKRPSISKAAMRALGEEAVRTFKRQDKSKASAKKSPS